MVEHLQANVSVSLLSACARLTYCHVYSRECLHYHYFDVGYLMSIISRVTSAECMLQTARFEFYSAPIGQRSIVMTVYVCVCVCVCVR